MMLHIGNSDLLRSGTPSVLLRLLIVMVALDLLNDARVGNFDVVRV